MKRKLTVLTLVIAALVMLAAFFPAAAETAAPANAGPAKYTEAELNEKLTDIVMGLQQAGVGCTAYDVDAETGSIRIAVPHSRYTPAKNALSRLDLIKNDPELPVFLFSDGLPASGVEGGERIAAASGRIKPNLMLAVAFGVICLILFYPVHRARQRQIQMMRMRK
ncbi:MAG: hypothetical protein IKO51_05630 [Clostridia bacterium]|nr:hypothetical protein [Clostridia bacterium]